jgi:hypothetical protein
MNTIVLSGEDKGRHLPVRPMTTAEVKQLQYGQRVLVHTGYFGRNRIQGLVHVKVNGNPKIWKTRPKDVTVPIKYGLYEYARVEYVAGEPVDEHLYFVVNTQENSNG